MSKSNLDWGTQSTFHALFGCLQLIKSGILKREQLFMESIPKDFIGSSVQ